MFNEHGSPKYMYSDNGPAYVSQPVSAGQCMNRGHEIDRPRKQWQNEMLENFNGKFRNKFLYMEWLQTKSETRGGTVLW